MTDHSNPPSLRFGIIGSAAGIAESHLKALTGLPGATIVGMADIAIERGAARARAVGCPFFADHRAMLDAVRPDVAVICAPHPLHAALAIDCLDAGAHVLVEKPLAVSVSEADAMIAAADRAGRLLAVCFQQRFRPVIEHARTLIESGAIGDIVRVLCVEPWFRTQFYYDSAAWRGTWRGEGGGVLMNQGPHPLDLLCHLTSSPAKVWGWVRTMGHTIECEDVAQALLEYPNGAPGYIYFSTVEAGSERRMEIVGDCGALVIVFDNLTIHRFAMPLSEYRTTVREMWSQPQVQTETFHLPSDIGEHGGHLGVYLDLVRAIAEGRRPRCDAREARMSLELSNAIIYSGVTGQPVTLPLDRQAYDALLDDLRAGRRRL
ncbi:MAG: gfo/Idh/MocA family oxidoreductase [Roseiflexus castenholzii]|uniref:Gfo/Idh/MocA family protein n=1 Tax=Roseiflexus castenholzii TaxID=120962 RepID=UPI000CBB7728|nr:MAG: gfo/Idh/MocA family oxidoreductase [Roseiflexus castenholzii]